MEGAGIANQSGGISEESVTGFAAAVSAVRWRLRVRRNFGKHDAADVHLPGQRKYAAVYRRENKNDGRARGPREPPPGVAERPTAGANRAPSENTTPARADAAV